MLMSISVDQKKRGRPATGITPQIGLRLPSELSDVIDTFAMDESVSRSEAIRRLIEAGLKAKGYLK